jgi:hypothetical protein
MAAITRVWTGEAALEQTPLFGGSDAVLAADQAYDYSADIDLETAGEMGCVVRLGYKGDNITDDLICDLFASLDGSAYDTHPFEHKVFKNDATIRWVSFIVRDWSHFRIGLKSGTATQFEYEISTDRWTEDST